jgi:hypothetical protein
MTTPAAWVEGPALWTEIAPRLITGLPGDRSEQIPGFGLEVEGEVRSGDVRGMQKSSTARNHTNLGTARQGIGRKPYLVPHQILNRIGPRPTDNPVDLPRWYLEAIAEILWLYLTTGRHVELLRALVREVNETAPALRLLVRLYCSTRRRAGVACRKSAASSTRSTPSAAELAVPPRPHPRRIQEARLRGGR